MGFEIVQIVPMTDGVSIAFEVAKQVEARLAIYDCSGHLIRRIFEGVAVPGVQRVVWDGRSSKGGEAASGIYHAVLQSQDARAAKKLLWRR